MGKRFPLTTVIGIAVAFISLRILDKVTDWGGLLNAVVALGIALGVVVIVVFIGGALGLTKQSTSPESRQS